MSNIELAGSEEPFASLADKTLDAGRIWGEIVKTFDPLVEPVDGAPVFFDGEASPRRRGV